LGEREVFSPISLAVSASRGNAQKKEQPTVEHRI
jgi:hypothetical protein